MRMFFKGIGIAMLILAAIALFSFIVMHLWNWLLPDLFGLKVISFWQAAGILVLSKILFGGFGKGGHGHKHKHHYWKHRMRAQWENMSEEEREKFKSGFKSHCRSWKADRAVEEPEGGS